MKILQIVTLLTPDNAYGGPMRVALNHVRALRAAGHDVELIAGSHGYLQTPESVDEIAIRTLPVVRLVPGTGFAGLFSPKMLAYVSKHAATYDLVHIHLARDLITLPIAEVVRTKGVPYVVQTHGMIDESKKLLALVLDRIITKRIVTNAGAVFYLTPQEKKSISNLFYAAKLEHLPNGVPLPPVSSDGSRKLAMEVLFLARLQERKRPLEFVRAAEEIIRDIPDVTFSLVGPDEGEAPRVTSYIRRNSLEDRVRWEGPVGIGASLSRLAEATIYVLPSVKEPFPMSVLEAMSLGLPVVITESNGLAHALDSNSAGLVIQEDPGALAEAIRLLLQDDDLRSKLGTNARNLILNEYSIDSVVAFLSEHYKRVRADVSVHGSKGRSHPRRTVG